MYTLLDTALDTDLYTNLTGRRETGTKTDWISAPGFAILGQGKTGEVLVMLSMGAATVSFDAFGDSGELFFLTSDGRIVAFYVRRVTFADGREPMYYTVNELGEATSPAMPAIAMQVILDARENRISEFLKTLH